MNNETPRILKADDGAILKFTEHLPIKCNILCVHEYRNSIKYDLNLWLDNELETYTRIYNVDSKFLFSPDDVEQSHPEQFCQQCGGPNPVWYADNELWNMVNGSPNGIICPVCFEKKAAERGINVILRMQKV